MTRAIELGTATSVELVTAYTSSSQNVQAAPAAPAWHVIGRFYMPVDETVQVEAVGSVSAAGYSMTVRLFDVAAGLPVDGTTTDPITSTTDVRVTSGAVFLSGGKVYQFQAQVIGASTAQSGVVTAQLV